MAAYIGVNRTVSWPAHSAGLRAASRIERGTCRRGSEPTGSVPLGGSVDGSREASSGGNEGSGRLRFLATRDMANGSWSGPHFDAGLKRDVWTENSVVMPPFDDALVHAIDQGLHVERALLEAEAACAGRVGWPLGIRRGLRRRIAHAPPTWSGSKVAVASWYSSRSEREPP